MIEIGQEYLITFAEDLDMHVRVVGDLGQLPSGVQLWNLIDLADNHKCMANTEKLLAGHRVK